MFMQIDNQQDAKARLNDLAAVEEKKRQDEEAKRKNPPFVQLAERRMMDLRKHLRNNPTAVEIFLFLAQHMGQDNIVICPTSALMVETGKSRATVSAAIKYLKGNDLIEVVKFGTTNGYGLNGEYVWKTMHKPGRYSVFENVRAIAMHSENRALRKKLAHVFQPSLFDNEENEEAERLESV